MSGAPPDFDLSALDACDALLDEAAVHPLRQVRWTPPQLALLNCSGPWFQLRTGNQFGKAQPLDARVLTPHGWARMGGLREGDEVIAGDGSVTTVVGVYPQGVRPVLRLTFDDGATTRCCEEHLWVVKDREARTRKEHRRYGQWGVMQAGEIRRRWGDVPSAVQAVSIPTVGRNDHRDVPLPLDPYLLGVLLGDGCLRGRVGFTTDDGEVLGDVVGALPPGCAVEARGRYDYDIVGTERVGSHRVNPVLTAVRGLGLADKLSYDKRVPDAYLFAGTEQRIALLQGLMDTDGCINIGGAMDFCSVSEGLARDVQALVRSLGGKAVCSERARPTYTATDGMKREGARAWRVGVRLPGIDVFRIERKRERRLDPTSTSDDRILRSIVPDGEAECQCIAVAHPSHTYITDDYIVTHNTWAGCAEIIWRCLGKHPYKEVRKGPIEAWVICKSWSQSIAIQKKLWALLPKDEIAPDTAFTDKNGFAGVQKAVVFRNGSVIRIKTIGQDVLDLESATIHYVWIDEPLGDEGTFSALQMRLRRTGGHICITQTPATTGDLTWLREICVEGDAPLEVGKVRDLHFRMEPENFIPEGTSTPLLTEDGVPMDAAWIELEIAKTLPWQRGVRCHGEWEYAVTGQALEAFHRAKHVRDLRGRDRDLLPKTPVELSAGLDYGEDALRTCGVHVYTDLTGEYPRIFVMGEYAPREGTTIEMDAVGILGMLAETGDRWSDLDYAWADKRYEGRTSEKNARLLLSALAKRLGVTGELRPQVRVAKRGLKRDHFWPSVRWLHEAMIRPGHFVVDESCAWLIEALEKWDGTEKSPHKDVIDALRYALRHLWGPQPGAPGRVLRRMI